MQGNFLDFPIAKFLLLFYNVVGDHIRYFAKCNKVPIWTFNILGKEVIDMLFAPKEKGQGLVEYALILVLVSIVVIAILLIMGPAIGDVFSSIVEAL